MSNVEARFQASQNKKKAKEAMEKQRVDNPNALSNLAKASRAVDDLLDRTMGRMRVNQTTDSNN